MELQIGDLILVKGAGPLSRAIEDVEHNPYSHIAGYVGEGQLIEANGFRRTGYQRLEEYAGKAGVFRYQGLTDREQKTILNQAKGSVGGHYDYALLFIELVRYWFGVILPYREPPNLRICSVLWAGIYRDAGIDLCPGIVYPSPADLAESKLLRKVGNL